MSKAVCRHLRARVQRWVHRREVKGRSVKPSDYVIYSLHPRGPLPAAGLTVASGQVCATVGDSGSHRPRRSAPYPPISYNRKNHGNRVLIGIVREYKLTQYKQDCSTKVQVST
ncbi:hypothetical protein FMEAI12_3280024 [Parafrankia sp. Ea1.12]|nr:hypothetical protein FMEAI12_3280024 [Parafrankia sp. Ea1.12]